jgi:beta-lactamase class D
MKFRMMISSRNGMILSGKTGTGGAEKNVNGWFVGYV